MDQIKNFFSKRERRDKKNQLIISGSSENTKHMLFSDVWSLDHRHVSKCRSTAKLSFIYILNKLTINYIEYLCHETAGDELQQFGNEILEKKYFGYGIVKIQDSKTPKQACCTVLFSRGKKAMKHLLCIRESSIYRLLQIGGVACHFSNQGLRRWESKQESQLGLLQCH